MRLVYYLKCTLKGMLSNIPVVCGYFILFPILIAGVMGFASSMHNADIKVKPVTIKIENNDNSELSKNLVKFLENKEIEKVAKIDKESKNTFIIPKGYGKDVLESKQVDLIIKEGNKKDGQGLGILESMINKYNENLYLSLKNEDVEAINKIQGTKVISVNEISEKGNEKKQNFGRSASITISFVISLLVYSLIRSSNVDLGINIHKRVRSFPLTRSQIYLYDYVGQLIYVGIIILSYVFFFNLTGVAFRGNILELLVLIGATTVLASGLVSVSSTVFGKKWSNIAGGVIFFVFAFGGELFPMAGDLLKSPTALIEKTYLQFTVNGSFSGNETIVLGMFGLGIVLFIIGFIKTRYFKERAI